MKIQDELFYEMSIYGLGIVEVKQTLYGMSFTIINIPYKYNKLSKEFNDLYSKMGDSCDCGGNCKEDKKCEDKEELRYIDGVWKFVKKCDCEKEKPKHECTCDLQELMLHGCKCGGK